MECKCILIVRRTLLYTRSHSYTTLSRSASSLHYTARFETIKTTRFLPTRQKSRGFNCRYLSKFYFLLFWQLQRTAIKIKHYESMGLPSKSKVMDPDLPRLHWVLNVVNYCSCSISDIFRVLLLIERGIAL